VDELTGADRCDPEASRGRVYTCGRDAKPRDVASPEGSTLVCPKCLDRVLLLVEEHADQEARLSPATAVAIGIAEEGG